MKHQFGQKSDWPKSSSAVQGVQGCVRLLRVSFKVFGGSGLRGFKGSGRFREELKVLV